MQDQYENENYYRGSTHLLQGANRTSLSLGNGGGEEKLNIVKLQVISPNSSARHDSHDFFSSKKGVSSLIRQG